MRGKIRWTGYVLLTVALVAGLLLASCTKPAPGSTTSPAPKPSPAAAPAAKPTGARIPFEQQVLPKYVVATAEAAGGGQIRSGGWASLITKYASMKGAMTLNPTLKGAIELLRKGEVDFFILSPSQPMAAYLGDYEKEGIKKLRLRLLIGAKGLSSGMLGIWVLPKSGIKDARDLKGKRIGAITGASQYSDVVLGAMNAHGWTEKDYTHINYSNITSASDALVEGKIDAVSFTGGPKTIELSKTDGIKLLELTKQETDAIVKLNPALQPGMTTPELYGAGASKWGIVLDTGFWSRADLSEKVTYTMVKVLNEHIEEWNSIHERCSDIDPKMGAERMWLVPYHPGVIRYYKEIGVWKNEYTVKQKEVIEKEKKLFGSLLDVDMEAFKELGVLP